MPWLRAVLPCWLLIAAAPALAQSVESANARDAARADPEAAVAASSNLTGATALRGAPDMVVAAHPVAVEAGRQILARGGNAVDAAVAVQLVLNVVEPQSSGLGGGGFLLFWDAAAGRLTTFDGREKAPAAARPDRFLNSDGAPSPFFEAARSGLSIGVPGLARLLGDVHAQHGRLSWSDVVDPALRVAADGFEVTPRLHGLLSRSGPSTFDETGRALFFPDGERPVAVGTRLRQPALAETLSLLQRGGAEAFYEGEIAERIVAAQHAAPLSLRDLTLDDLAGYRVVARPPVCAPFRGYRVCGMGPPSSGGLAVGQILGVLDELPVSARNSDDALHMIAEASRLAFADRNHYVADPDHVAVPTRGMLDADYLATRARLIDPAASMGQAAPGRPPEAPEGEPGRDAAPGQAGTTHISIVDRDGNAVALTSSIETAFGSGHMAAGMLLNNQLTDFAFQAQDENGRAVANRIASSKRPRSSMAPTMVFAPDGGLWAVVGSPGGSRIIAYVTKAIVALIDWKMTAREAAALPNFANRNGPFEIELGRSAPWRTFAMARRGHDVRVVPMTSGLHIAVRRGDGWEGGADPRREGRVATSGRAGSSGQASPGTDQ